jgi:hypothetical protein
VYVYVELKRRPLVRRLFVVFGFNSLIFGFGLPVKSQSVFVKYNSLISKHVCIRIPSPMIFCEPMEPVFVCVCVCVCVCV